jgi:hypothetical protein
MRQKIAITLILSLTLSLSSAVPIQAAALTAMSITGTGITANSAPLNSAITPTINFTTATALNTDGQTISITLNGISVAAGQTLAAADLTLTACTSNTLEDAPGTGNNGAHEVTITNGSAGDDNPVIVITLDATAGPTPPSCGTGAKTLAVAAAQLVSHDTTAGNFSINISTSADNGAFFLYVADENDVLITATVDNTLSFVIRNTADSADQPNVGGGAVGPNLCDLGNLGVGGVQSCSYRLKVATNAATGYYVVVTLDDDLNNLGDTAFLPNTATGAAPAGGVAGYNILLAAGAATGGSVVECPGTATGDCAAHGIDFSDATGTVFGTGTGGDADYLTGATMFDVSGPNNPAGTDTTNTALVTHRAEQDASSAAGTYNQLATYTVTAVW